MHDEPAIHAAGLRKNYGPATVLNGIDLRVARGEVLALLGPNGAGKTTTVRILATLTRPDGGTVRVAGHDALAHPGRVRRVTSLTSQDAAVDEQQTGVENLRMMARLRRLPRATARRRAAELLDRFDLADAADRRVATYSGGMRRRLDLACGLVTDPEIVFLDEPTTGLDPRSRQAVWQVVGELTATGVTVLLTTQYLEEVDRLADRIALLNDGRVVAEGTAAQLKDRVSASHLDLVFATTADFEAALHLLGGRVARLDSARRTLGLPTDGSAPHVRGLLDEVDPHRTAVQTFTVRGTTLDDVFLALTGTTKETTGV